MESHDDRPVRAAASCAQIDDANRPDRQADASASMLRRARLRTIPGDSPNSAAVSATADADISPCPLRQTVRTPNRSVCSTNEESRRRSPDPIKPTCSPQDSTSISDRAISGAVSDVDALIETSSTLPLDLSSRPVPDGRRLGMTTHDDVTIVDSVTQDKRKLVGPLGPLQRVAVSRDGHCFAVHKEASPERRGAHAVYDQRWRTSGGGGRFGTRTIGERLVPGGRTASTETSLC